MKVGVCAKCGSNEIDISEGLYRCKKCGYIGAVTEWLQFKISYLLRRS